MFLSNMIPTYIADALTKDSLTSAANAANTCELVSHKFFFIPTWYEFLKGEVESSGRCAVVFSFPGDVFAVALALLDILLRVAGFIAVVMIIVAGFSYVFSLGNPEKITNSRKRIQNALIGLAITFVATLAVTFIGRTLR